VKAMNEDSKEDVSNDNDSDKEYNGYYVRNDFHQQCNKILNNSQEKVGDWLILLDSQSTHSTFYSAKLVQNIRDALKPLQMLTNAGTIIQSTSRLTKLWYSMVQSELNCKHNLNVQSRA
jgi:hypothetical protein